MLAVILVSMWLGYLLGKKRMEKLQPRIKQRPQPRQIERKVVHIQAPPAPTHDIQKLLYEQHQRSYRQGWDSAIEKLTIHNREILQKPHRGEISGSNRNPTEGESNAQAP